MRSNPPDEVLRGIFADTRTIAVVGASTNEEKPANKIPHFLQRQGYRIVPVTPAASEVLGETAYPSLDQVPAGVDVVDVFRPAEEAPAIARQAAEKGAKVLWLQQGVASEEAAEIAAAAGMRVVMDVCMGATYHRLHAPPEQPGGSGGPPS